LILTKEKSKNKMDKFLEAAIQEAKIGLSEGGIPIGSVLVTKEKSSEKAIISAYSRKA